MNRHVGFCQKEAAGLQKGIVGNNMAAVLVIRRSFAVIVLLNLTFTQVCSTFGASIVENQFDRFIKKYNRPYKAGDNVYQTRLKTFQV